MVDLRDKIANTTVATCCGTPLIFTFMFSGAEWYCRSCKGSLGIMNAEHVPATPELIAEKEKNEEWFQEVAKDLIPRGCRIKSCEKCAGEDHLEHATKEALQKSKDGYAKL